MTLLKYYRPGFGNLIELTFLSILGIKIVFMLMTMWSLFESKEGGWNWAYRY